MPTDISRSRQIPHDAEFPDEFSRLCIPFDDPLFGEQMLHSMEHLLFYFSFSEVKDLLRISVI